MQVEDILDMSLDILQLRGLRSLRQISTICLRDLEIPQDLHQTTGIGFKCKHPDIKKCLQSKTQTVIFQISYHTKVQGGSGTEHMNK